MRRFQLNSGSVSTFHLRSPCSFALRSSISDCEEQIVVGRDLIRLLMVVIGLHDVMRYCVKIQQRLLSVSRFRMRSAALPLVK